MTILVSPALAVFATACAMHGRWVLAGLLAVAAVAEALHGQPGKRTR